MDRIADMDSAVPDLTQPIHEAIFWRGLFLHRYSGVEYTITELLVRALGHEQYHALGPLPFPWPKRLKLLTKVLNSPGPIQAHAAFIREKLIPLTSVEKHRHMLAHAMMAVDVRGDDPRALYFRGHDWKDREFGQTDLELSIDELIAMTESMGPLTQDLTRYIATMFRDLGLEAVDVEPRVEFSATPRSI
jgi:hypothetical protein